MLNNHTFAPIAGPQTLFMELLGSSNLWLNCLRLFSTSHLSMRKKHVFFPGKLERNAMQLEVF